jgi:hypothetical protein|tara:strand:+ start:726 stop:1031 length:306 start_codon:yes stop_codon:yes gene_type:complete
MSTIPEQYVKIELEELPLDRKPKYKIGDLVTVGSGTHEHLYGFYLKEGMGLITEISAFKVLGLDTYKPQPIYMIEYKINWAGKKDYAFILEHSITLIETGE